MIFSKKNILQTRVININHVIEKMERMLQRIIGENITLTTSLSPNLHNVIADQGQIEQIMLNLIVNARDAISGRGSISISTKNYENDEINHVFAGSRESYVLIRLQDDGCGIDQSVIKHIFEPFFTTKKNDGSTGLGLSTVYGIVNQSNGYIDVKSGPYKGTTFEIYLPATDRPEDAAEEGRKNIAFQGKGVILVVEDEQSVRDFVVKALEMHGYEVYGAEDGRAGLTLFKELDVPVDMVLSDVIMPGLNGYELFHELRKIDDSIRIMYMSGYTDDYLKPEEFEKDGVDFIQKPFEHEALLEKIQEFMGNKN